MIQVLFVAFESLPFVKTGGLADVVYALPKALNKKEYEVRCVLPLIKTIKDKYGDKLVYEDHIYVNSGYIVEEANIFSYVNEGIKYYFIENDTFFGRDDVYGYHDDAARFAFFNMAVLEMCIKFDYYPDIMHEHDYHTAVLPALCKLKYNAIESIRRIKHIFTIHNLVYQGVYDKSVLFDLFGFDYRYYEDGSLRFNDCCNFMKIGIVFADAITTVSKTYAKEIQTSEYGENLEMMLRYRRDDLFGIVNGIDTDLFNPSKDEIFYEYNLRNYLKGKSFNKAALQRELGLNEDPDALLIGIISRLTFQKGIELFINCLPEILKRNVQIAVLGTGESKYEYALKMLEEGNKGRCVFYCGYNEKLAHSMYAGLDMLLMPSLFEPCGISQLVAMRYGTIPFVRETGGLYDTVEPYNEYSHEGRGFTFGPYDENAFMRVFDYAYTTYVDRYDDWKMLIRNAMKYDVSFKRSALDYEEIYKKVLA